MTDDEDRPKLRNLSDWNRYVLLFVIPFAILLALSGAIHDEEEARWSEGHQVIVGIALIEAAVIIHLVYYPHVAATAWDNAVTLAYAAWSLLPVIPWQPWHVTTTMGGVVGPLFILNGLRGGGG